MRRRTLRLCACALGAAAAVALVSACGGDSSGARPDDPSTVASTTTTATAPSPPPTTFPPDRAGGLRDAVRNYMEDQRIGASFFLVRNLLQSPVDPSWARFNVAPTPGNETVVDSQFGVAHFDGARWTVIALGMEDVGCGPEVPAAVRDSLQLGCSSG